jgi:predicted nucleotidyltransferase component of viral defense system
MIPQAAITHWRNIVPWPRDAQVEQDLILSRAVVEIFQDAQLATAFALRGGTALNKLHAVKPHRYSEDIDLVQLVAGPIGSVVERLRSRLDPWLGKPRREKSPDLLTLRYRMQSEVPPITPLRLKIEINLREHFSVFGLVRWPFGVHSPWFRGEADVATYSLEELLATKLRALYQRRKGRDLFDLWIGLGLPAVDPERIVQAFRKYMSAGESSWSRKAIEENLEAKQSSRQFHEDLKPLLTDADRFDPGEAGRLVRDRIIALL